jgi:hypothetical protein
MIRFSTKIRGAVRSIKGARKQGGHQLMSINTKRGVKALCVVGMMALGNTLSSRGWTCMGLGGGHKVGCNLTNSNCSTLIKKKAHVTWFWTCYGVRCIKAQLWRSPCISCWACFSHVMTQNAESRWFKHAINLYLSFYLKRVVGCQWILRLIVKNWLLMHWMLHYQILSCWIVDNVHFLHLFFAIMQQLPSFSLIH